MSLDAAGETTSSEAEESSTSDSGTAGAADGLSADGSPTEAAMEPSQATENAASETNSGQDEPTEDEPTEDEPTEDKPGEKQSDGTEPAEADAPNNGPEADDNATHFRNGSVHLVMYQPPSDEPSETPETPSEGGDDGVIQETTKKAEPDADKPVADEPAADKPDADKPAADKPAADKPDSDKPDADKPDADKPDADKPATGEPSGDQTAGEASSDGASDEAMTEDSGGVSEGEANDVATPDAADGDSAEANSGDDSSAATPENAGVDSPPMNAEQGDATSDEPSVPTFEAMRDEIARSLAEPKARQAITETMTELANQLDDYYTERSIAGPIGDPDPSDEPFELPDPPDFEKLAETYGLTTEKLNLITATQFNELPIAQTYDANEPPGRGSNATALLFGDPRTGVPPTATYLPRWTTDVQNRDQYLMWKPVERNAYSPEFNEVRDEVVRAVRYVEARKLATEDAKRLAEAANGETPLTDVIPEAKRANFKANVGPFTWLQGYFGFGVVPGNVPELNDVGEDFMEATFTTSVGDAATATNNDGTVVVVVEPVEFTPEDEALRERFKQPRERQILNQIASGGLRIQQGFNRSVEEQTGLEEFLEAE